MTLQIDAGGKKFHTSRSPAACDSRRLVRGADFWCASCKGASSNYIPARMAHRPKIKSLHGMPAEIEAKFTLWAEEQMGCASIISVTQSGLAWRDLGAVTLIVVYEEDEKAVAARLQAALAEPLPPKAPVSLPLEGGLVPPVLSS